MESPHPDGSQAADVASTRNESINPYLAPLAAPESAPIDKAALKDKSSVQAQDFLRVAMSMKAFGVFLLLPTLLLLFGVPLVGLACLPVPLAFIMIGLGLDAFKPWAWTAAVLVAVPSAVLGAGLSILLGILTINSDYAQVGWWALVLPAAAAYISWTLLSRSGRQRYRSVIEAKRRQAERPRWTKSADEILAHLPGDESSGEGEPAGEERLDVT